MSETSSQPSTETSTAAVSAAKAAFDAQILGLIVAELNLPRAGVAAVVKLLVEGATVPFIARYRKEATGGLDEVDIRKIEERRTYLSELEERRASVLEEIKKQGKLTEALEKKLRAAATKAEVEDLYLPYKPKRRTRGTIAKERGLEPLADILWSLPTSGADLLPAEVASRFVDPAKEVPDVKAALAGARDICAERISEDAGIRKRVRDRMQSEGVLRVQKTSEHEDKVTKFDTYAKYEEKIAGIPSHRFLAIRRGETEGVLRASLEVDVPSLTQEIAGAVGAGNSASPWVSELRLAVEDAYKRLLATSVEVDVRVELKLGADRSAIGVFAENLRELLLAAPYGTEVVLGIDPGQRTGCKCAVMDGTGRLLENTTIYLVQGDASVERARATVIDLVKKHNVKAVAIGNGTHGRETEAFVRDTLKAAGLSALVVPVSESGASVYSASDVAREEFPDLDLTVRGAISIGRRLQDPLAELVKVDPKSIGVGQYQHDVSPAMLERKLGEVVESCVNSVGVELNTASAPLLARVAGIGPSLAKRIVAHRNEKGRFASRKALSEVPGIGPKTFEQAAGFLRVRGGAHPLDASAVHPERYALVERIASDLGVPVASLVGSDAIARIDPKKYQSDGVGEFTMNDILAELKKPGRDPRATFEAPKFRDDVRTMEDLKPGMMLEGIVTNVAAFGAFVDIGVHQDGLVHVSQIADRFVKDPFEVVKVGDKLRVKVLEVDMARKRISLSARSDAKPNAQQPQSGNAPQNRGERRPPARNAQGGGGAPQKQQAQFSYNPFAKLGQK
ncbi:MAG: Tex family protein [Polyangiaceae bacterium]